MPFQPKFWTANGLLPLDQRDDTLLSVTRQQITPCRLGTISLDISDLKCQLSDLNWHRDLTTCRVAASQPNQGSPKIQLPAAKFKHPTVLTPRRKCSEFAEPAGWRQGLAKFQQLVTLLPEPGFREFQRFRQQRSNIAQFFGLARILGILLLLTKAQ